MQLSFLLQLLEHKIAMRYFPIPPFFVLYDQSLSGILNRWKWLKSLPNHYRIQEQGGHRLLEDLLMDMGPRK